jgi:hypothetical protein
LSLPFGLAISLAFGFAFGLAFSLAFGLILGLAFSQSPLALLLALPSALPLAWSLARSSAIHFSRPPSPCPFPYHLPCCYIMRNFGTYFIGTYMFLLVPQKKCMLHDFVRYQNTRSRDSITLLSMDIMVETFLEIGTSDLLVSTCCMQESLYMEV